MLVQGIKLVTGQELVAEVVHGVVGGGGVELKNPLLLMVAPGKDGLAVNFFPWTIIAEGNITVNSHAIVARYDVPSDVEAAYIQNTSGIQIVSGMPSQLLQG